MHATIRVRAGVDRAVDAIVTPQPVREPTPAVAARESPIAGSVISDGSTVGVFVAGAEGNAVSIDTATVADFPAAPAIVGIGRWIDALAIALGQPRGTSNLAADGGAFTSRDGIAGSPAGVAGGSVRECAAIRFVAGGTRQLGARNRLPDACPRVIHVGAAVLLANEPKANESAARSRRGREAQPTPITELRSTRTAVAVAEPLARRLSNAGESGRGVDSGTARHEASAIVITFFSLEAFQIRLARYLRTAKARGAVERCALVI